MKKKYSKIATKTMNSVVLINSATNPELRQ